MYYTKGFASTKKNVIYQAGKMIDDGKREFPKRHHSIETFKSYILKQISEKSIELKLYVCDRGEEYKKIKQTKVLIIDDINPDDFHLETDTIYNIYTRNDI